MHIEQITFLYALWAAGQAGSLVEVNVRDELLVTGVARGILRPVNDGWDHEPSFMSRFWVSGSRESFIRLEDIRSVNIRPRDSAATAAWQHIQGPPW